MSSLVPAHRLALLNALRYIEACGPVPLLTRLPVNQKAWNKVGELPGHSRITGEALDGETDRFFADGTAAITVRRTSGGTSMAVDFHDEQAYNAMLRSLAPVQEYPMPSWAFDFNPLAQ